MVRQLVRLSRLAIPLAVVSLGAVRAGGRAILSVRHDPLRDRRTRRLAAGHHHPHRRQRAWAERRLADRRREQAWRTRHDCGRRGPEAAGRWAHHPRHLHAEHGLSGPVTQHRLSARHRLCPGDQAVVRASRPGGQSVRYPPSRWPELVALLKSQPDKFNFSSGGFGTPAHLTGELFKLQTGARVAHVPYQVGERT